MLLLDKTSSASQHHFSDHIDTSIRYTLPEAVTVAETMQNTPDFFLLRYAGDFATERGGILRGALNLLHAERHDDEGAGSTPAPTTRPVPFIAGYSRLLLRPFGNIDETDIETGHWHRLDALEQSRISLLAYLDTTEAQILRSLLADASDAVSLELKLVYRGLVAGMPGLIHAESERLNTHMHATLGSAPASVDQIIAAFLSLPEGVVTWRFIGDERTDAAAREKPPRNTLHTEAALHALDKLFEPVERSTFIEPLRYRYLPRDSALSPDYRYALVNYRQEERIHTLGWSISELVERLTPDERARLFPTVSQVSPFAQVTIYVVNSLPFDPAYLTSITVDVKNIGARGIFENRSFQFSAEETQVAQFSTFQPVLTSGLQLQYRITAVLAPPAPDQWPVVIKRDFVHTESTVIEVNRESTGIDCVHIHADTAVFSRASAVEVALTLPETPDSHVADDAGNGLSLAAVTLTSDRTAVRIALPDRAPENELYISSRALPPANLADAAAFTLHDGALVGREVSIHTYQLEVLDPDEITATLAVQASERYPFVAFEIISGAGATEGTLRTLEPGRTHLWHILRGSVFTPLYYRYRLHVVARHEGGGTLPLVVTSWFESSQHQHILDADVISAYLNNPEEGGA